MSAVTSPHPESPSPTPTRLAIVVSHPIQYYSPWFRWMHAHAKLELNVFYLWDAGVVPRYDEKFGRTFAWDVDLRSGYPHEFVPNRAHRPSVLTFFGLHNPTLRTRLHAWGARAILLFGYAYRTNLGLLLRPPAPIVFRGDSHLLGRPRPGWLKRMLLRRVYRRCAAVASVGLANRAYFEMYGVSPQRLFHAPHCVDDTLYVRTPKNLAGAHALRRDLDLGQRHVVLFAGKLVASKQPRQLLQAFLHLAPPDAALVFCGDGPEREGLVALAKEHPEGVVRFLSFANQSEMPTRYALADILALPSSGVSETWGLVVNEAMHLGVPCLVSDRVGCQQDLVTEGETGWVFPVDDAEGLARALHRALAALRRGEAGAYRTRVAARIAQYTYAHATDGLLRALASLPK